MVNLLGKIYRHSVITDYFSFYLSGDGTITNRNIIADVTDLTSSTNKITVTNDYPTIDKYILDVSNKEASYVDNTLKGPSSSTSSSKPKQGRDATANIDDIVAWLIETTVPTEIGKMSTYKIVDTMEQGLAYKSSSIVGINSAGSATTFTADSDYTITDTTSSDHKVTFAFNATGIKKLSDNNCTKIYVYFNTTVTSDISLGEETTNEASLVYTNNLDTQSTYTTSTTETVEVHTSGYQLKKVNSENTPLKGVTFKLYATEDDANADTNALSFYSDGKKTTVATSDENGIVSFNGLAYGSFGNKVNEGSTTYWVVETSTNSGYNLLEKPFKIVVSQNSYSYTNTKTDVVNTAKFELPKTGIMAGITISSIGIVCFAIALVFVVKSRKKSTSK
jgi:fimbrial isopeptide formation D2 family protein/LPXTG-motif cell wall-anchored protein